MIAEQGILVPLLHAALLFGLLRLGSLFGGVRSVGGAEPLRKGQLLPGGIGSPDSIKEGKSQGAVGVLLTLSLHKVDGGIAYEVGHEGVVGPAIDGKRGVILLKDAVVDEADLGRQGHSLHLVVGHIDEGGAGLQVEPLKLGAHLQT